MKIIIIDNYDSFTYNLSHMVKQLGAEVCVKRNDKFKMSELEDFDKIILSPGPGIPKEAGQLIEVIKTYAGIKPILGVCLGHQAIGEYFGGQLTNLKEVHHGIQSQIEIEKTDYIFQDVSAQPLVGRYHSWVVSNECLPKCLEITSVSKENEIMSIRHKNFDIAGIQFHPESVLTPEGTQMMKNWIEHK